MKNKLPSGYINIKATESEEKKASLANLESKERGEKARQLTNER